ncbi:MAG TPA: isoprenylcysteine carboxylmethyltransferase family protein [Pirellulales bacterium]|nr:isoprenylcysteine carboxylmethyltransferase family protein [Pirellulales bacterium]
MAQQAAAEKSSPRVRVVPPVYLLAAVAGMIVLAWLVPGPTIIPAPWNWLGLVPLLGGIGLGAVAARLFARHKTAIRPGHTSSHLLTAGPYHWTRNPIYVAMTVLLAGVALMLGVLTPWLLVPVFVAVIAVNVIPVEEAMLGETFGEEYRAYQARVRRWI